MNPPFKVEVLVVLQKGRHLLGLSRTIELPFPPYRGLYLYGLTPQPGELGELKLHKVAWDCEVQVFYCETKDDIAHRTESMNDLLKSYGPEWEINEPGQDALPTDEEEQPE